MLYSGINSNKRGILDGRTAIDRSGRFISFKRQENRELGGFCFYETKLIIYKSSQLKKTRGAFGAIGALVAQIVDEHKQKNNSPDFVIPYLELDEFLIDKSLLFGNGIKVVLADNSSIKMDIPPKYYYEKIAAIIKTENPNVV